MPKTTTTFRIGFSAQHSLSCKEFSDAENLKIFGKCFRTHGHDYFLEVTLEGSHADEEIRKTLDHAIHDRFHKTHLNDFFGNTTGETLVQEFHKIVSQELSSHKVVLVKLQETPKNHFVVGDVAYF